MRYEVNCWHAARRTEVHMFDSIHLLWDGWSGTPGHGKSNFEN